MITLHPKAAGAEPVSNENFKKTTDPKGGAANPSNCLRQASFVWKSSRSKRPATDPQRSLPSRRHDPASAQAPVKRSDGGRREKKAGATNPGWSKMARENEMQEFIRGFFRGRPDLRCTRGCRWGWKGQGRGGDSVLTHVSAARSRTPSCGGGSWLTRAATTWNLTRSRR